MASITSVISIFVLLAVYCYSAPIEPHYDVSTSSVDHATEPIITDSNRKITMQLVPDDESTYEPNEHKQRTAEQDTLEFTTSGDHAIASFSAREMKDSSSPMPSNMESSSEPPRNIRGFEDFPFTTVESSTELEHDLMRKEVGQHDIESSSEAPRNKRGSEFLSATAVSKIEEPVVMQREVGQPDIESSSELPRNLRSLEDFAFTTLESSTEFENRVIIPEGGHRGVESSSEPSQNKRGFEDFPFTTVESSTEQEHELMRKEVGQHDVESSSIGTRSLPEEESELESSTNFQHTSSIETFGKYTGLLKDEHTEGKMPQQKVNEPKSAEDKNGDSKENPSTSDDQSPEESREQEKQHGPTKKFEDKSEERNPQGSPSQPKSSTTVSTIPERFTETKVSANAPSHTSAEIEPIHEHSQQLSQVEKQPVVEKKKSDN